MNTRASVLAVTAVLLLSALSGLLSASGGANRAFAQGSRLAVIPAEEELAVGTTTEVAIRVENVASLWGGQIALRYDPAVVQVVDEEGAPAEAIQPGEFLDPRQSMAIINTVDAATGRIEYAVSLRHNPRRPVDPATGSGTLARIRLKGVGAGTTTLAFSAEGATYVREIKFVDGDLNEFTLPTVDGTVTVTGGDEGGRIYLPVALKAVPLPAAINLSSLDDARTAGRPASIHAPARPLDDPELITATGQRIRHMALDGDYAYWSEGAVEIGCEPGPGEARIARVNLLTGTVEDLVHDCASDPGALVVSGGSVYYIDGAPDAIVSAAPGSPWITGIASGNGLGSASELAQDATHLYFEDSDGIKSVAKAGGEAELLVSAGGPGPLPRPAPILVAALAVDGSHVYWLQTRTVDAARTVIYRVRKTGGTPEAIYEPPDTTGLSDLALDATHVYWTQAGGIARRVAKGGGTAETYGTAGSWLSGNVAVDEDYVYWSDELRLRRAPKDRSAPPENLLLDMVGIKDLHATTSGLVWAGGRAPNEGIWTLPLDAGAVTVDLQITGFEVTQAIQNMALDVPLIRHKATLVRLYPLTNGPYVHDVPAQLRGFRDGAELPGSPLTPLEPTLSVRWAGPFREQLDQTFNFLLPEDWTAGTVELRGEINPGGVIPEANTGNNTLTETVTFTRRDAMCLEMLPVRTEPVTASTRDPGFQDIADWVRSAYPVPGLRIRRGGMIQEPQWCRWRGLPYPCRGPFEMPDDSDWVLAAIWLYNLFDWNEAGCDTTFYVGMVHQDGIVRDGTTGSSYVGGRELWTMLNTEPDFLGGRWPWYLPHGGSTMSHELGHSLGRRHVDCGGPAADTIDGSYPYGRCDIGPDNPMGFYGTDVLDLAVIAPTEAGDLMSYAHNDGKPRWPSDWTYQALMAGLPEAAAADAASMEAASAAGGRGRGRLGQRNRKTGNAGARPRRFEDPEALVMAVLQAAENLAVTGVVSPTSGAATLASVSRLPDGLVDPGKLAQLTARVDTSPTGRYRLQLEDASGAVLSQVQFDVPEEFDAPDEVRSFQVILPFDPTTARVVLREGAAERASRAASAAPPTVKVVAPNGGETVAGPLTVQWEAEDPDGDTLSFTVQYSADAGGSWQPLAIDTFTTTLTVDDMTTVPGSAQALVRVIASDGLHTASDTSDGTFVVKRRAPEVEITRPDDRAVVSPGRRIIASGTAYDPEDGTIDGDALRWFVDGAAIGRGGYVAVGPLAIGSHTLTLRAADGDQQAGEDSITIHVQEDPCASADSVDLLFVLDTSPPMREWLGAACSTIKDTLTAFQQAGYDIHSRVLGVTQQQACTESSVRELFKQSAANHPADWGVAVADLATHYSWRPGASRIIVPITNQGPEDGDPVDDADVRVVQTAISAALARQVRVVPWLALAGLGPQPEPPELPLAYKLARATGGQVLAMYDGKMPIPAQMLQLVPSSSCVPTARGVSPNCGLEADDTLTLFGHNLTPDTRVLVGAAPARDVAVNADGTRLTFRLPAQALPGRTYDVRVERTAVGGDTLPGAVTFGPCSDRCDDYSPGDIVLPMWRIRAAGGEVVFEARATGSRMTARLYAHDGPVKLLVQQADGTGISSAGVPTGTTGQVTVDTEAGRTYLIIARNAHAPATRFRLYVRGAQYARTADDGDDWVGPVNPGRGENNGAVSYPELGFAGRWTELDPQFATTTWYFNVDPDDAALAVRVWSESTFGEGHGGMAWVRPDGTLQPLIGSEPNGFDRTWQVNDPQPGFWGLRIRSARAAAGASAGADGATVDAEPGAAVLQAPPSDLPTLLLFAAGYQPQGYSLARVDQPADDWLYFRAGSMLGPPCGPTVQVLPGPAVACVGEVRRADILIADVANLYGAEVHLSFPNDLVEAVDENGQPAMEVIAGTFLDPTQGLVAANAVDNDYGLIDYAISLRDPAPAAFGSGVLASVYFRARAAGDVAIAVDEAKLSERPLPPAPAARPEADLRGGAFAISDCYDGGRTAPGTVRGQAVLDGRTGYGGAPVTVPGMGTVLTDADGNYTVRGLAPGAHQIDVRLAGYLRAGDREFDLGAGEELVMPTATLLGGDCNGSDGIDVVDASIIGRYYSLSAGWGANQHPDINADGVVDIYDLVMVGNNFGCRVADTDARCRRWDRR